MVKDLFRQLDLEMNGLKQPNRMSSLDLSMNVSIILHYQSCIFVHAHVISRSNCIEYFLWVLFSAWHKVSREVEHYSQNGAENGKGKQEAPLMLFLIVIHLYVVNLQYDFVSGGALVYYYCDNEPNPMLKGMLHFDCEQTGIFEYFESQLLLVFQWSI